MQVAKLPGVSGDEAEALSLSLRMSSLSACALSASGPRPLWLEIKGRQRGLFKPGPGAPTQVKAAGRGEGMCTGTLESRRGPGRMQ